MFMCSLASFPYRSRGLGRYGGTSARPKVQTLMSVRLAGLVICCLLPRYQEYVPSKRLPPMLTSQSLHTMVIGLKTLCFKPGGAVTITLRMYHTVIDNRYQHSCGLYDIGMKTSVDVARTMTFAVMVFCHFTIIFSIRSGHNWFTYKMFTNRWLWLTIAFVTALTLLVLLVRECSHSLSLPL